MNDANAQMNFFETEGLQLCLTATAVYYPSLSSMLPLMCVIVIIIFIRSGFAQSCILQIPEATVPLQLYQIGFFLFINYVMPFQKNSYPLPSLHNTFIPLAL